MMRILTNHPLLLSLPLASHLSHLSHLSHNNPRLLLTLCAVFVEASQRVKDKLNETKDARIPSIRQLHTIPIRHYKTLLYYVDNASVIVVDETFKDMFSTAYVRINGLPNTFIGSLDDYQMCVYLLRKQLKWNYEELDLMVAKFRVDIMDRIMQLKERDLMPQI
jgi:hypothetical protein